MQGLELSRAYYEEYGYKMIHDEFPELEGVIAVGLVGSGSECYGYDDDVSEDHDFEPGFCLFIPGEDVLSIDAFGNFTSATKGADNTKSAAADVAKNIKPLIDSRTEFKLTRAYAALPKEFMGHKRSLISPVGGSRHGVIRMDEFWTKAVGAPDGKLTTEGWLNIPEYALAEATNGEIFRDDSGVYSSIRKNLRHYPNDIRKKKLAGYLLLMEQAGEYNYERILRHGETTAAQFAIFEFVQNAMHVIFLLNDRYMPYYKWSLRAMRGLAMLAPLVEDFDFLMTTPNDKTYVAKKLERIDRINKDVITVLKLRGFTDMNSENLEQLAYAVNDTIEDSTLRNMNIMAGV